MSHAPQPLPMNGAGLLIGGPKPGELRIALVDHNNQVIPLKLGPGLGVIRDQAGDVCLSVIRPMTATVSGQKALKQADGSYILPMPIPGAIPSQLSGHAIYSSGMRLTPEQHYAIATEENIHRIVPAAGFLGLFLDEVMADYLATY